jgi:hypothetical protein
MVVGLAVEGGVGDHDRPVARIPEGGLLAQAYVGHEPAVERHRQRDRKQIGVPHKILGDEHHRQVEILFGLERRHLPGGLKLQGHGAGVVVGADRAGDRVVARPDQDPPFGGPRATSATTLATSNPLKIPTIRLGIFPQAKNRLGPCRTS